MIKKRLLTSAAAVVLGVYAPNAVAQEGQGCYAQEVLAYSSGTLKNGGAISEDRMMADRALGVPQNDNTMNFVSLGYGGSLTLGFGGAITDGPGKDIYVVETSFASNDCLSDGIERAQVYLSQNGTDFVWAGELCRDGSVDIAAAGLDYAVAIRIDNDASSTTPDGYDVDGVYAVNGCGEIPAMGCFATNVVEFMQGLKENGQPITDPIRIDPSKALGMPENDRSNGADNFVSLGAGGWLILEMGAANNFIVTDNGPGADIRVYETTWGNMSCNQYPEYAEISVSANGTNWYSLGTHCQSSNISLDIDAAVPGGVRVRYVKIQTMESTTEDNFDVDGVEAILGCEEVNIDIVDGCYAECTGEGFAYVQGTTRNGGALPAARTNANNALGEPQMSDVTTTPANNNFVSLGYGGSLTLCFDGFIENQDGADMEVIETSFGNPSCESYPEYADVYISANGTDWYFVTTGCHNFQVDFSDSDVYLPFIQYVRIVNNDTMTTTPDGYDVDGVVLLAGPCESTQAPVVTAPGSPEPVVGFRSYPNPSRGLVNFNFSSVYAGNALVELYNLAGQRIAVVFDDKVEAETENVVSYDMSNLANGIYVSKLTTSEGVVTGKVMLAR
ncbi:MAG: T9SS type A sorting domain-containing protein [Chitinophagaceae bacterium]|nr:MAG: T9SS type A sorting domain-containing protein [Chitinophagaceae bacterium]